MKLPPMKPGDTQVTIILSTTKRSLLYPFFRHLVTALWKGVDGGGYSVDGRSVAEWHKEILPRSPHVNTPDTPEKCAVANRGAKFQDDSTPNQEKPAL